MTLDLRAAIVDVEKRLEAAETAVARTELDGALEAVSGRIEALENASLTTELEAVRQELEEQKTRPVTVAGLDEIRSAIERLERRPDRADEISQLADEISALAAQLDHMPGPGELKERLETVAEQTEVAQAGVAGLQRRIDELAALERRLDEVAERVSDTGRIDELALRVDDMAASIPAADTDGLTARIDALEEEVGPAALRSSGWQRSLVSSPGARRSSSPNSLPPGSTRRRWRRCGRGSRSWRSSWSALRMRRCWRMCGHGWMSLPVGSSSRTGRRSTSCGRGSMSSPLVWSSRTWRRWRSCAPGWMS